jgi:hypothetical protein
MTGQLSGGVSYTVTSDVLLGAISQISGSAIISLSGELKKRVGVRQIVIKKKYWL